VKKIYVIISQDNPRKYFSILSKDKNSINTAWKMTLEERNNNKFAVAANHWRFVKICEDGKLVDVPYEAEE
jgi:hypothetical protein